MSQRFPPLDTFAPRHIGPRGDDVAAMLKEIGAASVDTLIDEAIPASIRLTAPLNLPDAESESTYLARLTNPNPKIGAPKDTSPAGHEEHG